jgi:hypothetical protein
MLIAPLAARIQSVPSQRGTDGVRHTFVAGRLRCHYIIILMKAAE